MGSNQPRLDAIAVALVGLDRSRVGRSRFAFINLTLYALCFSIALVIASVLVVGATDASPFNVIWAMYEGSLSRWSAIGRTLNEAAPIYVVALGAIVSGRAGILNIGNEGQVLIGGTMCALFIFGIGGPPVVVLPLGLLVGAIGGALWAGIAAVLRFWRGVDVVISTLLCNFIAIQVISFAVNKPWLLQESTTNSLKLPQSNQLDPEFRLPMIGKAPGFAMSTSVFIATVLFIVVTITLTRTRWGFRLRMLGLNPTAARSAGIWAVTLGGGALMLSGAFAGLAGGMLFTGTQYRIVPGFSLDTGYNGLLVALISRRSPNIAIPLALFFGVLRTGGGFLSATGVPTYITGVVKGLVVLFALLPPIILRLASERRALVVARREALGDVPLTASTG